jgi:hypothetical protein
VCAERGTERAVLIVSLVIVIVVLVGLILLVSKVIPLFKKSEAIFKQVESSIQMAAGGMTSSFGTSSMSAGNVAMPNAASLQSLPAELRGIVQQVMAGAASGHLNMDDVEKLKAAAQSYGHHVIVVNGGEAGHELTFHPGEPPADATTNIPPPPPGVAPQPGVAPPPGVAAPPTPPAAPPA